MTENGADRQVRTRPWKVAHPPLWKWVRLLHNDHRSIAPGADFPMMMGEVAGQMANGVPMGMALMIRDANPGLDGEIERIVRELSGHMSCAMLGPMVAMAFSDPLFSRVEPALRRATEDNTDITCGVALSSGLQNHEDLLLAARIALHRAIAHRRGYFLLDPPETQRAVDDHQMTNLMRRHLADGGRDFEAHYQPQVDMRHTRPKGAEALARWRPDGEDISPTRFVHLAEEAGLIGEIGELMFVHSARTIRSLRRAGIDIPRISVNVSPHQRKQGDFLRQVLDILRFEHLSPADIEIEITESIVGAGKDDFVRWLSELMAAGFAIAIDDFGTGSSTLARIVDVPAGKIKLDRAFVTALPGDAAAREVCRAALSLVHALGKESVAEGVESLEQAAFLNDLECRLGQGFLWARPMPEKELIAWWQPRGGGFQTSMVTP